MNIGKLASVVSATVAMSVAGMERTAAATAGALSPMAAEPPAAQESRPVSGDAAERSTQRPPAPGSPELEFRAGERNPLQISVRGGVSYDFETDVDDTDGSVSALRAQAGLGLSYALSRQWLLNLDVDAEVSAYDFSGFAGVIGPSDEPVDEVGELTLRPGATYLHSSEWAFFGSAVVQFAGEFDADAGDSTTFGGLGGARWQVSDSFAVSFGLIAKTRLEDSALVVPLVSVDWRINETWGLASTGLEATLSAKIGEQWSWLLVGGWRPREYRLADDNDLPDGVFRDDRAYVGTGIEYRPNPISSIRLTGGVTVWNELRFEDSDGNKVFEEQADPTGYIALRGTIRF